MRFSGRKVVITGAAGGVITRNGEATHWSPP